MTANLGGLLLERVQARPDLQIGTTDDPLRLDDAIEHASRVAGDLEAAGMLPGDRLAVIGSTSTPYLVLWLGCQLAGVAPALINPTYPDDLLDPMLRVLDPSAVATPDGSSQAWSGRQLAFEGVVGDVLRLDGTPLPGHAAPTLQGLDRDELDVAGFMHTSGTTGLPKFCAQSHRYYLRLGRLVADELHLGPQDRVLAPLPMFHINPMGYGFLGALTGRSDVLGVSRFRASSFWPTVIDLGITVLVLHAPPVEILKRRTSGDDADGHRVRAMFYADAAFLTTFDVPVAVSGYGSTEVGGLSHVWTWRRGEDPDIPEGIGRVGGRPRYDIESRLTAESEILVRPRETGAIFDGYVRDGVVAPAVDPDGWFHTGDLGRYDEQGRLVFVERAAESIRVKGEFVPIDHVEHTFADIDAFEDLAVWKRDGPLGDDEVVLYVVADSIPRPEVAARTASLPSFMRPTAIARVASIPRDGGAGKVRRRHLTEHAVIEWVPC